jgi:hypothetical protein
LIVIVLFVEVGSQTCAGPTTFVLVTLLTVDIMNTIVKLAVLVIAAGLVIGTTSMASPVVAQPEKDNAQDGLNKADDNVHENAPQNDVTFHEGLCQGGHSTDVLDDITGGEGCDANPPITDPGNSDENRQDE